MTTETWLTIIAVLTAIIGFFLIRIMNTTDRIADDVADMKPKVKVLWEDKYSTAHSPRQLNDRGIEILEESGIKAIVDRKKDDLLKIIKESNPTNPYDAEKDIMLVMKDLPKHCPDIVEDLKTGAFKMGITIDVVLFVGSIYLRNMIFKDLGFDLADLDKPSTSK